jgi:hypothetical protein
MSARIPISKVADPDPLEIGPMVRDVFHALWAIGIGIVGYFVHKLDGRLDSHEAKLDKVESEMFEPDGALRKGDAEVRDSMSTAVSGFTKELKALTAVISDLRVEVAVATGAKVTPRRPVNGE